ncbi:hypothetical protein VTN49DRAFT_4735 [Thermomyces lanuginosus]|uniref:uncharacterized protein n=1 Tax=Thermomyces lanuginosus TaxID=5541 RepID=UPI003743848A
MARNGTEPDGDYDIGVQLTEECELNHVWPAFVAARRDPRSAEKQEAAESNLYKFPCWAWVHPQLPVLLTLNKEPMTCGLGGFMPEAGRRGSTPFRIAVITEEVSDPRVLGSSVSNNS